VGDDIEFRNIFAGVDFGRPPEVLGKAIRGLAKGSGPLKRAKAVSAFMRAGPRFGAAMAAANCEAGARLAERLGMTTVVTEGLLHIYERWDGKGVPKGLAGDQVPLMSLIGNFAHVVTVHHRPGRLKETADVVRRRTGNEFAPDISKVFLKDPAALLEAIEAESVWETVLDVEPEPRPRWPDTRIEEIGSAFAHFTDLKSPFMLGHSSGVADLAEKAAGLMGLPPADVAASRIAGLLHDLGRVSVPNTIWEKPSGLSPSEWERVRLHAYYTERVLSQTALLHHARVAGMHHERLDESGYHRGLPAALLPAPARVLAAADSYHAMTEERPHRSAFSADAAAKELSADAASHRLDREVVAAVLEAAGQTSAIPRASWPAGLTDREVDVIRLVAKGRSNREIAEALYISGHTVHHHVLHVYQKIGVSTRAAAALFAMENDLLRGEAPGAKRP
jgi:HD-GYP domain-containing protein (c-di-GMP phosphodiesterase class II)/DNA-binding CsgD family transcriptional regulator